MKSASKHVAIDLTIHEKRNIKQEDKSIPRQRPSSETKTASSTGASSSTVLDAHSTVQRSLRSFQVEPSTLSDPLQELFKSVDEANPTFNPAQVWFTVHFCSTLGLKAQSVNLETTELVASNSECIQIPAGAFQTDLLEGKFFPIWDPSTKLTYTLHPTLVRFRSHFTEAAEAWNNCSYPGERKIPIFQEVDADALFQVLPTTNKAVHAHAFFPWDEGTRRVVHLNTYFLPTLPRSVCVGILTHELGHVLGLRHEHANRAFLGPETQERIVFDGFNFFDVHSVMLYPSAVGKKQSETVLSISVHDALGLNMMYNKDLRELQVHSVLPIASLTPQYYNRDGVTSQDDHVGAMDLDDGSGLSPLDAGIGPLVRS